MIVRYKKYKGVAGIYKWENLINHKCYIGQSIDLNKRLAQHFSNIKNKKCNNPLYRAVAKYGLENFDVTIIETLNISDDLKSQLDEREKYYIQKYNSYGRDGYNQTIGDDGGILGYRFTEDQKNHVSKNSLKQAENYKKIVYLYNVEHNYYQTWMDAGYAARQLRVNRSSVQRLCSGAIKLIKKEWVGSFSKDDLELRIKDTVISPGCCKVQYVGKFIYKDHEYTGGVKDAAKYFNVSESYIYGICNKSRKSNILSFIAA